MDKLHWEIVQQLFQEALELPAKEQIAFLRARCDGNEPLYEEVASLLLADRNSNTLLDGLAIDVIDIAETFTLAGRRIGPYDVVEQIGSGGMGAVFLATRTGDRLKQRVALKVIRPGLNSEQLLKRFKREEAILAQLNHPHIARLLDSGASEDGIPYLAMEYVEGKPLDHFVSDNRLSLINRLAVFQTICSAVAYAHQNNVIHRDLKPDNIFVNPYGAVKLLDFGISKIVQTDTSSITRLTRTGMKVMTVEYAAPEQVQGKAVTTATDIYALGVILYELLCGFRPFHGASEKSLLDLQRAICDFPAPAPSVLLGEMSAQMQRGSDKKILDKIVQGRRMSLVELRKALEGNLDRICLKALEKKPENRYSQIAEMIEETQSYIDLHPDSG